VAVPSVLTRPLERCYRTFADVERPTRIDSSHYKSLDIAERALSRPLAALSDDDIGPYASCAILTVGGPEDYRYFLPRILELSVAGGGWLGGDPPIIASRLIRAGWENWRADQQSAVSCFFDAAYGWSIGSSIIFPAVAELWLCGNILIGDDVVELLDRWRRDQSIEAARQLSIFFCNWRDAWGKNERLSFWEDIPKKAWDVVSAWLLDSASERQIEAALDSIDPEDRWELERALVLITNQSEQ
jgi:hypothetical protein